MVTSGVRVCAAVALAGVFWATPQALGAAHADGSGSSVSADAADGGQRSGAAATTRRVADRASRAGSAAAPAAAEQPRDAVRASRRVAAPGGADPTPAVRAVPTAAAVNAADDAGVVPGPAVVDSPVAAPVATGGATRATRLASRGAGFSPTIPSPPRAVASPAPASTAASVGFCGDCWAFGSIGPSPLPPVLGVAAAEIDRAVNGVAFTVEGLIDSVGIWLAGFPANPVTEFLSGALWLVRRTLFPVGSDVGTWGSVPCVATKDCAGQDLRGSVFEGVDLSDVDFTGANLNRSVFRSTNAESGRFAGASFRDAAFVEADFRGADLSAATLDDVTVFPGEARTDFTGANLTFASMRGITVPVRTGVTLVNANLTNVDFGSIGRLTTLWYSDLTGAILSGADLGAQSNRPAYFLNSNFTQADLTGANLDRATLVAANLTEANLSGATLVRTNLRDANLTGANLTGADIQGAFWGNTTCPDGSKTNTGCSVP